MDISKIEAVVGGFTAETDLFLVEVKVSPMNEVEVVLDSDTGVSIDQCVALSRAIEEAFDRDVEDFELSVMSAGIGQPLKLARQYRKALGKPVEVVMKDGMKYAGLLESADEGSITVVWEEKQLVEGKKRRQTVEVRKEFLLSEVKSTVRQLAFK
jgi:ribosome maturation factor RimP